VKELLLIRRQLGDAIRHLLLAGGELVHALPHRGES
jgi:hypothetical protein